MSRPCRTLAKPSLVALLALCLPPTPVLAGMPQATLTDLARMRFEAISFFALAFFLSCGAVQLVWNWLRRDFPRLPRLSYSRAVGLVGLWGFLFLLVLTMISGARELMTPGAWERDGATYRLAGKPDAHGARQ